MRITFVSSFLACICMAGILATPPPASAVDLIGLGGKLGFLTPASRDGTLAVGTHLEFEQSASRVHLLPNLMYWKAGDLSDLSANADHYYHFVREGQVTPYLGAGLGVNAFRDDRSIQSERSWGST